ncbi:sigma-70 family RNA polymerase sigma factor [Paenibacillus piri]|uniref:Sigma-70 family RNA polymerase sigma factor n=1 Tax=Paenibacillus piri TaxID=2547395 RepID=A0A4R5K888_9BACL|nr:sigma-70 family RNA polymerase sigma factor [Paenibacillus piri]TDF91353.1 sigma-70 family RNA polymerase sigma factor [Paenibacillus piri]
MADRYDPIAGETRALHRKFEALIEPHRQSLWSYCRYLTGSPWDGEDLFQETLLKAFATMAQMWHPVAYRSYLFRIATNTRIDVMRRKRLPIEPYEETESHVSTCRKIDPTELIEVVEMLVQHLPPRQIAVLLLMEVFGFVASEVAGMVRMTEGSVYAVLHRARANVRRYWDAVPKQVPTELQETEAALIETLLQAMRDGDSERIIGMLEESVHNDAQPGLQEYSKQEMIDGSWGHRGPAQLVSLKTLWGRKVFVVLVETDEGPALHDIREFEFDNGRIVYNRGFYFCKELLFEAGKHLGVPVQLQKAPGIDWRS